MPMIGGVSTYVPLILLILIIYALRTPSQDPENPEFANRMVVELFTVFGMILLAWHYTGQAWGMTASFAYIAGIRIDSTERRLIRSGYYALLVWHVLWACMVLLIDNTLPPVTSRTFWFSKLSRPTVSVKPGRSA